MRLSLHLELRNRIASYESNNPDGYGQHWTPSSSDEGEYTSAGDDEPSSLQPPRPPRPKLPGPRSVPSSSNRRRRFDDAFGRHPQQATPPDSPHAADDAVSRSLAHAADGVHAKSDHAQLEELKLSMSAALSTISFAAIRRPPPQHAPPSSSASFSTVALDCGDTSSPLVKPADAPLLARVVLACADLLSAFVITNGVAPFRVVHVNRAWTDLCGYQPHEALGKTCAILQGPLTDRAQARAFSSALATIGTPASMVVRNYTKCGEVFTNLVVSLPLRDDASTAIAFHAAVLTQIPGSS